MIWKPQEIASSTIATIFTEHSYHRSMAIHGEEGKGVIAPKFPILSPESYWHLHKVDRMGPIATCAQLARCHHMPWFHVWLHISLHD